MPFNENESDCSSVSRSQKSTDFGQRLASSKIPLGLSQSCNVVQSRVDSLRQSLPTCADLDKSTATSDSSLSFELESDSLKRNQARHNPLKAVRTSLPSACNSLGEAARASAPGPVMPNPLPNSTRCESPTLMLPETPSSTVWLNCTGATPELESTLRSRHISQQAQGSPLVSIPLRLSQETHAELDLAAAVEMASDALSSGTTSSLSRRTSSNNPVTRSHDIRPSAIPQAPSAPSSRSNSASRQSLSLRSASANAKEHSSIPRLELSKENKDEAVLVKHFTAQTGSLTRFSDSGAPPTLLPTAASKLPEPHVHVTHVRSSIPGGPSGTQTLPHATQPEAGQCSNLKSATLNDVADTSPTLGTPLPLPVGLRTSPAVPDSTMAYISTVARAPPSPDDASETSNCTIGGAISSSQVPRRYSVPPDTPASASELTPCSGSRAQGSQGPGGTLSFNLTTPSTGEPAISSDTPVSELREARLALYRNPVSQDFEANAGSCVATEVPIPYMSSPSKPVPALALHKLTSPSAHNSMAAQSSASKQQSSHPLPPARQGATQASPKSPVPAKFRDLDTSCLQEKLQEAAAMQSPGKSPAKSPRKMWDLPAAGNAAGQKLAPVVPPLWLHDVDDRLGVPPGEDDAMVLGSPHAFFELQQQQEQELQTKQQLPHTHTAPSQLQQQEANTKQPSFHTQSAPLQQAPSKLPSSLPAPPVGEPQDAVSPERATIKVLQPPVQSHIPVRSGAQQSRIPSPVVTVLQGPGASVLASHPTHITNSSDLADSPVAPALGTDSAHSAAESSLIKSCIPMLQYRLNTGGGAGTISMDGVQETSSSASVDSKFLAVAGADDDAEDVQGAMTALPVLANYSDLPLHLAPTKANSAKCMHGDATAPLQVTRSNLPHNATIATANACGSNTDAPDMPALVSDAAFAFKDGLAVRTAVSVPMVVDPSESLSPVPRQREAVETSLASWQTPGQAEQEDDVSVMDTPSTGAHSPASHGILLSGGGSRRQRSSVKKVAFAVDDDVAPPDSLEFDPERKGRFARLRRTPGSHDKTKSRLPQLEDSSLAATLPSHSSSLNNRSPKLTLRLIRAAFVTCILLGYTLAFGPRLQQLLHWTAARAVPAMMQVSPDASMIMANTLQRAQVMYTGSQLDRWHGHFQHTAQKAWLNGGRHLTHIRSHLFDQYHTLVAPHIQPQVETASAALNDVLALITDTCVSTVHTLANRFPDQAHVVRTWLAAQEVVWEAPESSASKPSLTNQLVSAWRNLAVWLLQLLPTASHTPKSMDPFTLFTSPINGCSSSIAAYMQLEQTLLVADDMQMLGVQYNPVDLQSMLSRVDACCGGPCYSHSPHPAPTVVMDPGLLNKGAGDVIDVAAEATVQLQQAAVGVLTDTTAAVNSIVRDVAVSELPAPTDSVSMSAPSIGISHATPDVASEIITPDTDAAIQFQSSTEPAVQLQSILVVVLIIAGLLLLVATERKLAARRNTNVSVPRKPQQPQYPTQSTRRTSIYTPGPSSVKTAPASGMLTSRLSSDIGRKTELNLSRKMAVVSPQDEFTTPLSTRAKPRPSLIQAGTQLFSGLKPSAAAAASPTPSRAAPSYTPESFIVSKAEVHKGLDSAPTRPTRRSIRQAEAKGTLPALE